MKASISRIIAVLIILTAGALLEACGQKGDLVLPARQTETVELQPAQNDEEQEPDDE